MNWRERDRLHWLKQAEARQITQATDGSKRPVGKRVVAAQEKGSRPGGGAPIARSATRSGSCHFKARVEFGVHRDTTKGGAFRRTWLHFCSH